MYNVRHEVMHAYIFNTCVDEATMDQDEFEEIICGIVGRAIDYLIEDSNNIYKQLLSIKDEYNGKQKQLKDARTNGSSE